MIYFYFYFLHKLQKMGFDEVTYTVDLKKGEVTKGLDFDSSSAFCFLVPNSIDSLCFGHLILNSALVLHGYWIRLLGSCEN